MEWRGQQVVYGIIEVIATHHLMHYVKGHTPEDRTRMAAGATMAGLGFVFGPELQERVRGLPEATQGKHKELIYTAGGAALGAVTAYLMRTHKEKSAPLPPGSPTTPDATPFIYTNTTPPTTTQRYHDPTTTGPVPGSLGWRLDQALAGADPAREGFDHQHPGGLLTLASAGWLGYSLFFDGKTKEEQHRHLWGLGSGALGYLYGPESLQWVKNLTLPKADGERAVGMFRDGSILLGATIGGFAGYTLGKRDAHA